MLTGSRPHGRLFYFVMILALIAAALPVRLEAQAPQTTQITDVVYRPDGTPAQGTVLISWGESQLAREAHNYFGIKAHGQHESIALPTIEVVGGVAEHVTARFARYASMAECFADRDALIARARCYAEVREQAGDPEAFARALARRWATDPEYVEKLLAVYRAHGLAALDK